MMNIIIALLAIIIERYLSYPPLLQKNIKHPVEWMGAFINWFDRLYNRGKGRKLKGFLLIFLLIFFSLLISLLLIIILSPLNFGFLLEALIASIFLAQKQLIEAVYRVSDGLKKSLSEAREAVSHIVGRDVKNLDKYEIKRAAIETLAENASDGYIAPLFYLLLFGLPGIIVYKAINTADSMIGHRSKKYKDFGFASAKLDDIVNFIPARISALLFIMAAFFYKKARAKNALKTAFRDAKKHVSPNAGWPEAALAGALNFSLGGKRFYNGKELNLAEMGNGRRNLKINDIYEAINLFKIMNMLVLIIIFLFSLYIILLQY